MANRWKGNLVANAATSSGTAYTGKADGAWGLNSQLQQKQAGLWSRGIGAPNQPTSVTAVKGDSVATVSFTLPTETGGNGATLSSYTVKSYPDGITATGTGSPITVTGLTNGTSYTFTVSATNSLGFTGPESSPSNSVIPNAGPTVIGQAYGGGFYGGKISDSGTQYYLIVAPKATGESNTNVDPWGPSGVLVGTNRVNGPANTTALIAAGTSYKAASFCRNLTIGAYNDWYLPARDELEVLYYFLKPTTDANTTSSGANPNAVAPEPISTNYTTSNPAQTSASGFITGGTNAFLADRYVTSSEVIEYGVGADNEWVITMNSGNQTFFGKTAYGNIRAVRRVPL